MEIKIRNQHFILLAQKAMFWKDANTLLISDMHLGKVTHFRKAGFAIPTTAVLDNFKRLDEMIFTNTVHRIIFLGDLFHNRLNAEWDLFAQWRNNYTAIEMLIVLGNHDILPKRLFEEIKIKVYDDEYFENEFVFAHHPKEKLENNQFIFCGHIHPVYCLKSKGRQRVKLPCFVRDQSQIILPSFGVFTGGYEMKSKMERKIYLVVEDKIILKPDES